ncbi:type II secretion system protein M [Porticoccaceae bacterium]|jgi:type II secretory pathway component PulM|nr:type II secretion system protein M [Porticoccaceae bacterium]
MKSLSSVGDWFAQLQSRERVIVVAGAAIVVIAAIYMALLPSIEKAAELEQRYQVLQADLQWLEEQGVTVGRLGNRCLGKTLQKGSDADVITLMLRRNQLKLISLAEQTQSTYRVSLESANANRILQLVHQLACQGLNINTLEISPTATTGMSFAATMEVQNVE